VTAYTAEMYPTRTRGVGNGFSWSVAFFIGVVLWPFVSVWLRNATGSFAAAFLLMGVMWAFIFTIIMRSDPRAFSSGGVRGPMPFMDVMYFSFITITTLGYGDILPVSRAARTAALLEAIIGQLFIAILIAKLVGVYPQHRDDQGRNQAFPS